MKLFRKLSALIMVLALLLTMSLSVFAADYDASNLDELLTALYDTSGEDVNINLTGSIDAGYTSYVLNDGITYNIGTQNDSTVGNIGFYGDFTVNMDVNVDGNLYADGGADINLNGNVSNYADAFADSSIHINGNVDGEAYADDGGLITVTGDAGGISAYWGGTVTVEGDVNGHVYATDGGNATVGGDVNGSVNAWQDSTVEVTGNVDSTGYEEYMAVSAGDNAIITIGGDVTSAGDGINAWSEATVTVGGDVLAGSNITYGDDEYVYGGTAVGVSDNATVTVGGDAIGGHAEGENCAYAGYGISAWGYEGTSPTVTVGGNAIGGNASTSSDELYAAQAGMGIQMTGSANVTVGGDVTAGDTEAPQSLATPGAYIACEPGQPVGSLTVGGNVAGGAGDEELGSLYISAWYYEETDEKSQLPAIDIGSTDSIGVDGFGDENELIKAELEAAFVQKTDTFHEDALWLVRNAEPGAEITIDAGDRHVISKELIEAVIEHEVTLTIKWNGGEDLVIDKTFSAEITDTYISLAKLAELLNK